MASKKRKPRTIAQRLREDAGKVLTSTDARGKIGFRWTRDQVQLQLQTIEALMLVASSNAVIVREMRERFDGVSKGRVEALMGRVRERWLEEDREARPTNKAAQVRRLKGYIARASRGERNANGEYVVKPDLKTVKELEQLLCRIEGNEAPVEVNVDVRVGRAATQIIAGLTREELQEMMEEAREEKMKAAQTDRLLGDADRRLVVVPG